MKYLYTVWFRDTSLESDEQDYEWPACLIIEAKSKEKAIEWGDELANKREEYLRTEVVLRSSVEVVADESKKGLEKVPKIKYGVLVSDDELGW